MFVSRLQTSKFVQQYLSGYFQNCKSPSSIVDSAWSLRCEDLRRAIDKMRNISSQEAPILLRASFSGPRVLHLLRCSSSRSNDHPALKMFDSQLSSTVCHITNSKLSHVHWLQASLPVKEGGLGVRRVASLVRPAFL